MNLGLMQGDVGVFIVIQHDEGNEQEHLFVVACLIRKGGYHFGGC